MTEADPRAPTDPAPPISEDTDGKGFRPTPPPQTIPTITLGDVWEALGALAARTEYAIELGERTLGLQRGQSETLATVANRLHELDALAPHTNCPVRRLFDLARREGLVGPMGPSNGEAAE